MAISVASFSFSWCSTGGPEAHSARCGLSLPHLVTNGSPNSIGDPEGSFCFPYHILSPTSLVPNSLALKLTDFLSPMSYIIVQSLTQSLEWHVWSSSSGNNCHAVQRSLSSGASVYEYIMGFYPVPFRQPNQPTWFLSITGHWNVSLPPVHYFGMACLAGSNVNILHNFEGVKIVQEILQRGYSASQKRKFTISQGKYRWKYRANLKRINSNFVVHFCIDK